MAITLQSAKFRNFLLIIILALIGYWLGPEDLHPGSYSALIDVSIDGEVFSIEYPFRLGSKEGILTVISEDLGAYQVQVSGDDQYNLKLNNRISYRIRILDQQGNPIQVELDDTFSTITGKDYAQSLPAIDRSGEWLEFSMRIPFKAKIATALLFSVAALWLTELVPLSAASLLIPVIIVVTSVTDPATVLQPFFHKKPPKGIGARKHAGDDRCLRLDCPAANRACKPSAIGCCLSRCGANLVNWCFYFQYSLCSHANSPGNSISTNSSYGSKTPGGDYCDCIFH
jgi:hypothetical protein